MEFPIDKLAGWYKLGEEDWLLCTWANGRLGSTGRWRHREPNHAYMWRYPDDETRERLIAYCNAKGIKIRVEPPDPSFCIANIRARMAPP